MNFTIHDATGRLLRTGYCPDGHEIHQAKDGESMVPETADLDLHYIVSGNIVERPINPAIQNGNVLSELPAPCVITINGKPYPCSDTTASLSMTHVGTYKVTVSAFPYLDANFTVEA